MKEKDNLKGEYILSKHDLTREEALESKERTEKIYEKIINKRKAKKKLKNE